MKGSSGFAPHNNLGSTEAPSFRSSSPNKNTSKQPYLNRPSTTWESPNLPSLPRESLTPVKPFRIQSLSDIGDSSSLFSTPDEKSFQFTKGTSWADSDSPVPFVFGAYDDSPESSTNRKMVNERNPANGPLQPHAPNQQARQMADNTYKAPTSSAHQFGQPSIPNSPLHKPHASQSSMFIQPKSRPELHRDSDKPAHPHFQAIKDATKDAVRNAMHYAHVPRAPGAYNAPVAAPPPSATMYTTTQAAPKPSFSSFGGTSGFSSANYGNNYVDLTLSNHRATEDDYDPFSFVDPAKAQADLKALFEGVMEDDDDKPRTRLRKKKKAAEVDSLTAKLKGLDVEDEEERLEVEEEEDDGTVEGIKVKLLPHQTEGLDWLIARELGRSKKKGKAPKGGILADDMGLGKTLQSIALIISNPKPTDAAGLAERKISSVVDKCTLVVAPLALIRQWEAEIKDKVESSHSLRVIVHHGPQRTKKFLDLKKYDVVITTYQILVSEFNNSSDQDDGLKTGCFGLHWYRVILDEAHTIKNRNAKATQACYALRSEYRWCLTGTPLQNNLDELQSLIKFLRIPPYDDLREFKDQIDKPMKNGRGDLALKRLRAILVTFMLRRTKSILMKDGALNPGGKPSAPGAASTTGFKVTERKIVKIAAEFSPEERRFYERLEARTDASIEQMMSGEKVNYASALVMLLRLRQACNHPKLVGGNLAKDSDALTTESAAQKSKSASKEIDEMADMFGSMGMESKKCEVCQIELGKQALQDGAIRCLDCEEDLEAVTKPKSRKDKKEKKKKHHRKEKSESQTVSRKPRNRNIVIDSDDEEDDEEEANGKWLVPEDQQGSLKLGKAGGTADENAEGGGEWLDSDDDDSFPDLKQLGKGKPKAKVEDSETESGSGSEEDEDSDQTSETDSDEEVEDEFGTDEEAELATIVTSTKITHLIKILGKEITEHKFIVFSQFTSMLDVIEPFLRQKGFKFTRYDGKMKNDLREASLERLRNDKNCRILLCSLKCGSLGLNLTAATRVVILEPFWNPFVEEQAIDRVHRLTQKTDVIVYKITVEDSVEERILDLQEKKRELAKQTIEGGGKGGVGKLGMKEILSLFKRDAEHSHPVSHHPDLSQKPRILKEMGPTSSTDVSRERKPTPPMRSGTAKEDTVYGRRW
ncbi:hypothetical protein HYFRA_00007922 [Hymenoscyphus fraxineus]|uniref:ATP-dependent helicase n=1 Tax=Hymenoscyphus fraxineus TaxID=746836 RepID=A0A9N9KPV9_9HELO|nr:hypothetical protein HYFRA_00007922 [Hymenoscyphus fraxineus]